MAASVPRFIEELVFELSTNLIDLTRLISFNRPWAENVNKDIYPVIPTIPLKVEVGMFED